MNKKAQFNLARKTVYWSIAGTLIVLVIFGYGFMLSGYVGNLTEIPPEVKSNWLAERFVNNPDCFAYYDEDLGKTISNSIDLDKFDNGVMEECYRSGSRDNLNFKVELVSREKMVWSDEWHEVDHLEWEEWVRVEENGRLGSLEKVKVYVQVDA